MLTIGLDFSQHLGLAWHNKSKQNEILIRVVYGDPIYQLNTIENLIGRKRNVEVAYEVLNSMRNKRTVESLMSGMGYLRWSLRRKRIPFFGYTVPKIRNGLSVVGRANQKKENMRIMLQQYVGKNVSDNHSDALGVLLYHLHYPHLEPFDSLMEKYTIKIYSDKSQKRRQIIKPFN